MYDDESALTFKRQLKLIALGALIGFVPAFMNTLLQDRYRFDNKKPSNDDSGFRKIEKCQYTCTQKK